MYIYIQKKVNNANFTCKSMLIIKSSTALNVRHVILYEIRQQWLLGPQVGKVDLKYADIFDISRCCVHYILILTVE